ncbi:MAG TPA: ABC transporter ATP-binding protein [Phycisphaerales bacterium]|nr:ABC transporter ATP-binding protein [Phycisphaerales bacterium]
MLVVDGVHKSFGSVRAVQGISFELKPGQVAGLLGPNGAGKTTTIRMITGFYLPDQGRVLIGGCDTVDQPKAAHSRLGYLPESTPLYAEMRVTDYLHFRGKLFGMDRRTRVAAIEHVISRCWLKDVRKRRVAKLSKGYKQRVGLAAALLHNPPVLVLDEPSNGLDPSQIRETRQLVRELSADRTMLMSSHILPEVERICDRVIIVAAGKVRADGSPAQLIRDSGDQGTYLAQAKGGRAGDDDRFIRIMTTVPYVQSARRTNPDRPGEVQDWTHWVLTSKKGAPDLREAIAHAAMQNGIMLRELRTDAQTLERVFLRLVEESEQAAPEPEPAAVIDDKVRATPTGSAA